MVQALDIVRSEVCWSDAWQVGSLVGCRYIPVPSACGLGRGRGSYISYRHGCQGV